MSKHENASLGVSFQLPDKITVRKQLAYMSGVGQGNKETVLFERMWQGALELIENWQCAALPDPKTLDLDSVTDTTVTQIIIWVSGEVSRAMQGLEAPKG